jgi:hypothetical protein
LDHAQAVEESTGSPERILKARTKHKTASTASAAKIADLVTGITHSGARFSAFAARILVSRTVSAFISPLLI